MKDAYNYHEEKLINLKEQIKENEEKNKRLHNEVTHYKEVNIFLNDQLLEKAEELKHYEKLCKETTFNVNEETRGEEDVFLKNNMTNRSAISRRDISSVGLINLKDDISLNEKKEDSQNPEEADQELDLIYNQLDYLLKEINHNQNDVPGIYHKKQKGEETLNLFCRAVLVILIDADQVIDGKNKILLQTFRLDLSTTFLNLKKAILNFWDLDNRENEFTLRFIDRDGDTMIIKNFQEEIDLFLKGMSNMKLARFLFISSKAKTDPNELKGIGETDLNLKNQKKNTITLDSTLEKLFSKFMGLTNYLNNKFVFIKKKEEEGSEEENPNLKKKSGFLTSLYFIVYFSLILIFFIFTIFSLSMKNPNEQLYFMRSSINDKFQFEMDSQPQYIGKEGFIKDILTRLQDSFILSKKSTSSYDVVGRHYFSFYRVKQFSCTFLTNSICYYPNYSTITADLNNNDYFLNRQYIGLLKDKTKNLSVKDLKGTFIVPESWDFIINDGTLLVKDLDSLGQYYTGIFANFGNPDGSFDYNFRGILNNYFGSGMQFKMTLEMVSYPVLSTALLIVQSASPSILDNGLRAFICTFHMRYPPRQYFRITITYEFPSEGGALSPTLSVEHFQPNIYLGDEGAYLQLLDLLRLIMSTILFFFTMKSIKELKNKNFKFKRNIIVQILHSPYILIELFIIFSYWASFGIKSLSLNEQTWAFLMIDTTSQAWMENADHDFSSMIYWFNIDNSLELAMMFLSTLLIINFIFKMDKIRTFAFFLKTALSRVIFFFVIVFIIMLGFAVCFNNVFGDYYKENKTFLGSFSYTMLISVGHLSNTFPDFFRMGWVYIIFLLFFVLVIYFFLNIFIGVYLESFRLCSLRKGYSYDNKLFNPELLLKLMNDIKNIKKKKGKNTPQKVVVV
jgi:hypothetical protein